MASLVLNGNTSGSVTLSSPAVSGTTVLTLPTTSGTVITSASSQVTGPAFSAYSNAAQSITTSTLTKVVFQLEEFDTASAFDNTTNYRFTPQVAGYYQVVGSMSPSVSTTRTFCTIYKNGSEIKRGNDISTVATTINVTALIYLNGTTDYIELYGYIVGTSPTILADQVRTYFQASMVRGA